MDDVTTNTTRTGGRGACERILEAASELFYQRGINATGVEALAERAHVSKRTLYQHFASKDEVVIAYVQRVAEQQRDGLSRILTSNDVPARQRLVDIFQPLDSFRGCPYVNASVEIADPEHPARVEAARYKRQFVDELSRVASEAGARDPEKLGHQLAVLSDGARSQSAVLQSDEPLTYARDMAERLLSEAIDG